MNLLLSEIRRSLLELDMGLKGDLSVSEAMETLMRALYDDKARGVALSHASPPCPPEPAPL